VNKTVRESNRVAGQRKLAELLGTDSKRWPKHCLIEYPVTFDKQIDLVAQAVQLAPTDRARARKLVRSIDTDSMKRWFINVALQSGYWRAEHVGKANRRNTKTKKARKSIGQKRLEGLFERDHWRCRYCGIRIAGNRKHFKRFAEQLDLPELVRGRTDETRHGLYVLMMASYDHLVPHSQGGSDDEDNLVTACWSCQFGKFRFSLDELGIELPPRKPRPTYKGWQGLRTLK
jgi:5-methylcytosine-specific restriction endonuclease McrA